MKSDVEAFIREQTAPTTLSLLPEIKLYQAEKVEPLWATVQSVMNDQDYPPPFWAFAWVGGLGLSRYLLDHPALVTGLKVLDFASGCGLGGIVAAKAGAAKVWFCDIDPFAVQATQMNAALNDVQIKDWGRIDLSKPIKGVDVIIVGDVCYEHMMSHRILAWLRLCVETGIKVILSDPGRAYAPQIGVEELGRLIVPASPELEDSPTREVTVWQLVMVE